LKAETWAVKMVVQRAVRKADLTAAKTAVSKVACSVGLWAACSVDSLGASLAGSMADYLVARKVC
jgi:hypothetical protein